MLGSLELCQDSLEHCRSALGQTEAQYRTLLEYAPEAIVILDADAGHFVDANARAARLFELSRAALLGADPVSLSPPVQPGGAGSPELARKRIEEALQGGAPTFEWVHRTAAGAELACEVRLVRMPAAGRRLVRGSITEVGERRRLERQVLQWQRLELLGQLAGGVAHDLNGVLMAIGASVEALAEEPPEALRLEAEGIRAAVGRGTRLTQRLLGFLRGEELRSEPVELSALTRDTAELLRRLLRARIQLRCQLVPSALVLAERHGLEQVLMNLVLNACDAMPEGGSVILSTRVVGKAIQLRVQDTGIGMSDATRSRMFEAFFSTKPPGKGTGLGLAIVQTIVSQAGGWIEVVSQPGQGTLVDVYLPALPEQVA